MTDFYRQTRAIISWTRLQKNLATLQGLVGPKRDIFALVKANAYGHGAAEVSQKLEEWGVQVFGVATLDEGVALRESGIKGHIYILDGVHGPLDVYSQHKLKPFIHSEGELQLLKNAAPANFSVGLKVDTGMGRLGFFPEDIPHALQIFKDKGVRVECLVSHLARADEGFAHVKKPFQEFEKVRQQLVEWGHDSLQLSLHNSAATIDQVESDYHWFRPGIAMYGAYPHVRQQEKATLEPVLEFKTTVISLKNYPAGSPIGYGGTFVTKEDSRIAILGVGYADGYPRLASNRGEVLVRGQRAPIVGRISMDLMAIDVSDVVGVTHGDEVTLIGYDGSDCIRAEDVASWAETISYEIFCGISARVPRVYVE